MVENGFKKRLFGVWLILVAISLGYLWIDHVATHQGIPTASTVVTVLRHLLRVDQGADHHARVHGGT